ncbi:hypothetical protein CI109_101860 [Kwoniella shandongensis]|uniref:Uncharacterized protein n=1 Tax=Kwoniella shandongensis TaxID=1734106 RepID=A0A5M6BP34_9TREE|nr:uncharacterized protein CI109_007040 [Kwoniella shandongensis]KAA5524654.1 hypothetical protein CI109_007040 [Kwoniella shandongensis]
MEIARSQQHHPFWEFVVGACGVIYFAAWSYSFYPQIILNFKRRKTTGLSPDFIYINPLGFLALTIWSWGAYFSPIARRQYQARHDGHLPQISVSDLAFSLHAFIISLITLLQVWWYARRSTSLTGLEEDEETPLIHAEEDTKPSSSTWSSIKEVDIFTPRSSIRPSILTDFGLVALIISAVVVAILVWTNKTKTEFLDWLYFVSTIKLIISTVKYVPQVFLNHKLRGMEGFAVGQAICDIIGSVFSFAQLVISSIYIEHDPSGIIANPAKLGLSGLSLSFDLIFLAQKYWLYKEKDSERATSAGDEE